MGVEFQFFLWFFLEKIINVTKNSQNGENWRHKLFYENFRIGRSKRDVVI